MAVVDTETLSFCFDLSMYPGVCSALNFLSHPFHSRVENLGGTEEILTYLYEGSSTPWISLDRCAIALSAFAWRPCHVHR